VRQSAFKPIKQYGLSDDDNDGDDGDDGDDGEEEDGNEC
jgi:hypothetical protein